MRRTANIDGSGGRRGKVNWSLVFVIIIETVNNNGICEMVWPSRWKDKAHLSRLVLQFLYSF